MPASPCLAMSSIASSRAGVSQRVTQERWSWEACSAWPRRRGGGGDGGGGHARHQGAGRGADVRLGGAREHSPSCASLGPPLREGAREGGEGAGRRDGGVGMAASVHGDKPRAAAPASSCGRRTALAPSGRVAAAPPTAPEACQTGAAAAAPRRPPRHRLRAAQRDAPARLSIARPPNLPPPSLPFPHANACTGHPSRRPPPPAAAAAPPSATPCLTIV